MKGNKAAMVQAIRGRAESGEVRRDLLGDGFWRSDVQRPVRPDLVAEGLLGRDGEPAGLADSADDL